MISIDRSQGRQNSTLSGLYGMWSSNKIPIKDTIFLDTYNLSLITFYCYVNPPPNGDGYCCVADGNHDSRYDEDRKCCKTHVHLFSWYY